MAKPNYSYEKRQKELAKQKKNEEKRLRKLEKRKNPDAVEGAEPVEGTGDAANDETNSSE
jgi:hypothetical protein